jgi:hypothetical protein
MISALVFGGVGIVANTLLSAAGVPASLYGPIAIAAALVGMVTLTGASARLVNRVLPTSETYRISRRDFAGCTGVLLLPANPTTGYAQVKDREGNVHNIKCRTARGALAKGEEILVVEYDEDTRTFIVDASPVSIRSPL